MTTEELIAGLRDKDLRAADQAADRLEAIRTALFVFRATIDDGKLLNRFEERVTFRALQSAIEGPTKGDDGPALSVTMKCPSCQQAWVISGFPEKCPQCGCVATITTKGKEG